MTEQKLRSRIDALTMKNDEMSGLIAQSEENRRLGGEVRELKQEVKFYKERLVPDTENYKKEMTKEITLLKAHLDKQTRQNLELQKENFGIRWAEEIGGKRRTSESSAQKENFGIHRGGRSPTRSLSVLFTS